MSAYVIDASVAIKWVIDEQGSARALRLRRQVVAAPDLLVSECANVIWKKVRLVELNAAEASMAIRLLIRAGIELIPASRLAARAVEFATLLEHSAYDCMYLALAELTKRPLVTADARLVRRVAANHGMARSVTALDLAQFAD